LRLRDPEFVDRVDRWFAGTAVNLWTRHAVEGRVASTSSEPCPAPPMFRLRGLAMRTPDAGLGGGHVLRGGPPARGLAPGAPGRPGAGRRALVMTEMVCVSAAGRITPGCAGLYADAHEAAWRRIVDFVHGSSDAAIGVQLGHSGRKGSTRLMWEGMDEPLPEGNWPGRGPRRPAVLPRLAGTPGAGGRRAGRDPGGVRRGGRAGRALRLRPARAALRARLPAVVVPVPADQPAHRPLRRRPARPA